MVFIPFADTEHPDLYTLDYPECIAKLNKIREEESKMREPDNDERVAIHNEKDGQFEDVYSGVEFEWDPHIAWSRPKDGSGPCAIWLKYMDPEGKFEKWAKEDPSLREKRRQAAESCVAARHAVIWEAKLSTKENYGSFDYEIPGHLMVCFFYKTGRDLCTDIYQDMEFRKSLLDFPKLLNDFLCGEKTLKMFVGRQVDKITNSIRQGSLPSTPEALHKLPRLFSLKSKIDADEKAGNNSIILGEFVENLGLKYTHAVQNIDDWIAFHNEGGLKGIMEQLGIMRGEIWRNEGVWNEYTYWMERESKYVEEMLTGPPVIHSPQRTYLRAGRKFVAGSFVGNQFIGDKCGKSYCTFIDGKFVDDKCGKYYR